MEYKEIEGLKEIEITKKVEALQYNGNNLDDIVFLAGGLAGRDSSGCILLYDYKASRESTRQLYAGDWVIRLPRMYKSEILVLTDEAFKERYGPQLKEQ